MPDTKITALTAITTVDPAVDVLPIVDVSDTTMAASGTTKKITSNQILGAGCTATLASATITGDLTVDTSTLYVSSSTDKVGIGTTSLSNEKLTVAGNISANAWLGRSNISAPAGDCSIFRSADNTLAFGIASSTAMTLNSTGLGVGRTPGARLDTQGSTSDSSAYAFFARNSAGNVLCFVRNDGRFVVGNGTTDNFYVEASGNVGVGVVPSAWASFNTIQASYGSFASNTSEADFSHNAYYNAGWKYIANGYATNHYQTNGTYVWRTAASGTAGNAITFTQAMTLSAAGSLVLGAAAVATTATDGFLYIPGCAGTPTGTPTAQTGRVPLVVDTTNNKLYFYSGGSWVAAN
jgi:hypothetical protein